MALTSYSSYLSTSRGGGGRRNSNNGGLEGDDGDEECESEREEAYLDTPDLATKLVRIVGLVVILVQ